MLAYMLCTTRMCTKSIQFMRRLVRVGRGRESLLNVWDDGQLHVVRVDMVNVLVGVQCVYVIRTYTPEL